MILPYWLLRLLPRWEYICPKCRKTVKANSHQCQRCGEKYPMAIRIPPTFLKDPKKLEAFVHKHVLPRVDWFTRNYLTHFFTVIFSDGFESGDFSAWTGTSGNCSIVTSPVHSGTYAAQFQVQGTFAVCYKTLASQPYVYLRFYYRWDANPTSGYLNFSNIRDSTSTTQSHTGLQFDGAVLKFYVDYVDNTSTTQTFFVPVATFTPTINTWYAIETYFLPSASGTGELDFFINGEQVVHQTGLTTLGTDVGRVDLAASTSDVTTLINGYLDDVVVADTYVGPLLSQFSFANVPVTVAAGTTFNGVVVTALDAQGNVCNGYTGSVYFTSTDGAAVLPYTSGSKYTYTSSGNGTGGDAGVHTFNGFVLNTVGNQTISVRDDAAGVVSTTNTITVTVAGKKFLICDGLTCVVA